MKDNPIPHLNNLSLNYVHLGSETPYVEIDADGSEVCLYALTGEAIVHAPRIGWHGLLFGGRGSVEDDAPHVLRFTGYFGNKVVVTPRSRNADFLVASWDGPGLMAGLTPAIDQRDHFTHKVGEGSYFREVREFANPPGYRIHCGETSNAPGGWSSYPAHATSEEAKERYAEHEEAFFCITPGHGIMYMDGWYNDGLKTNETRRIKNGEILATPLGSHPIVFTPGDWGWYMWCYCSWLRKEYNSRVTNVGTYVR